jgi:hypothetical protein
MTFRNRCRLPSMRAAPPVGATDPRWWVPVLGTQTWVIGFPVGLAAAQAHSAWAPIMTDVIPGS